VLQAAATIVIVNNDAANVGFNDPTPVAPVGGNTGTTLGQQRLIAFQAAANKWGATVTAVPTIRIRSQWTALTCTATSAVLGSAGATEVFRDFTGAPQAGTWFSAAETSAIIGATADPATPEINANFNVNLGQAGCLTGVFFYLGLDNNHGSNVDLVTVLTHEFAHGLGFQTFTNGSSGAQLGGFPSIWDWFLMDNISNTLWKDMTDAQRAASTINTGHLVWTGSNVTSNVGSVLGTPQVTVTAPASVAGSFSAGAAAFGQNASLINLTAEIMPVVDTAPNLGLACTSLNALNAAAVSGKIALVDRGTCTFPVKAKNVQNAGAVGMILVNNAAGAAPALGGSDPTVTIPVYSLSQIDGNTLRADLQNRSRTHSGVFAQMALNHLLPLGADGANRILMYAPNPFQSGSSVSHFDVTAYPNQLMEPAINADLTHEVTIPFDLTFLLLKDIGWH
jgi:hypothetical protein